jgi:hypothetical protein
MGEGCGASGSWFGAGHIAQSATAHGLPPQKFQHKTERIITTGGGVIVVLLAYTQTAGVQIPFAGNNCGMEQWQLVRLIP